MVDLTITAANVVANGGTIENGRTGVAVTAGQAVYRVAATGLYALADCDSATAEARIPTGIALHSASPNQPLSILKAGDLTIGATLTPGLAYYLSPTPGGICPVADVLTGDTVVLMGLAKSASMLGVGIIVTGVTL
ncbi:MAG: hypothetical protein PS018_00590 [bacterium]|nr:hypothetical protein [bacterium]